MYDENSHKFDISSLYETTHTSFFVIQLDVPHLTNIHQLDVPHLTNIHHITSPQVIQAQLICIIVLLVAHTTLVARL